MNTTTTRASEGRSFHTESATGSRFWIGSQQRTQANRESLQQIKSVPVEVVVTFLAIDWFNSVNQFRGEETEFLCQDGQFDATLEAHRVIVAQFIAEGERLVLAANSGHLLKDAGFSIEDIKATIESLRETFRGVHGPHNHAQTDKEIARILEAA